MNSEIPLPQFVMIRSLPALCFNLQDWCIHIEHILHWIHATLIAEDISSSLKHTPQTCVSCLCRVLTVRCRSCLLGFDNVKDSFCRFFWVEWNFWVSWLIFGGYCHFRFKLGMCGLCALIVVFTAFSCFRAVFSVFNSLHSVIHLAHWAPLQCFFLEPAYYYLWL